MSKTQFAVMAEAFIAGERLNTPVDSLVQYPQRGDSPARLAGVVVGVVKGFVYVRTLADLAHETDAFILGTPDEFEFATPEQEAYAGRYFAAALSVDVRLNGNWPPKPV